MNNSLFRKKVFETKSAFDKNFNANPNSMNPKTTFTVFIQPPDFGKLCKACGNNAKSPKTIAQLSPKPARANVSNIGTLAEPVTALPSKLPKMSSLNLVLPPDAIQTNMPAKCSNGSLTTDCRL